MSIFSIRQPADSTTGTEWPSEPPSLRLLELPSRLQVPLAVRPTPSRIVHHPAGTIVRKGQRLCPEHVATIPAALAPTSGRIVGSSEVQLLNGCPVPAVDIESDFEDRPLPGVPHDARHSHEHHELSEDLHDVSRSDLPQWIDRLQEAGVWAERSGSYDLLSQLHQTLRQPIDTLICNLLDDEPTMRLNSLLAVRSSPMLLAGLDLLFRLTEARRVCLVVEAGSPGKWWAPLRRLARKAGFELTPVLNDYPQGDTTMLMLAVLDRRLKPGRSPVDQKAIVIDAAAAIAVGRCAVREQPMLKVPLSIRDHVRHRTHFVVVPIGMSVRHILEQCGASMDGAILRRGAVLREHDVSVDAVVSGAELTLHLMPRQTPVTADPCIRCSWCIESCPVAVQPAGLLEASQRNDLELARHYGLDSCIQCGVCSYMCPSRLPLLVGIRKLKQQALELQP